MSDLNDIVGDDVAIESDPVEQAPPVDEPAKAEPAATQPEEKAADEPKHEKVVPLAALHEERTRRKELTARLDAMTASQAERDAKIEARLAAIVQANAPPAPTFEESPAEYLKNEVAQGRQAAEEANRNFQTFQQQQEQERMVQRAASEVNSAEAAFAQQTPDYLQAVDFMRGQRTAEFEALGHDAETAKQLATREMMEGAIVNASKGINPAQVAYRLAQARGYKPKAAGTDAATTLENQQKGVAAARSLGSGGSSATGKPSIQALLDMTDDEFNESTKGNKWEKLFT